jgi:hypothetical protein
MGAALARRGSDGARGTRRGSLGGATLAVSRYTQEAPRIGGYVSGGLLIFFGIAVIALGIWGFAFTRDHIEREGITFGPIEDPAVAKHAEQWAGEPVDTGRKALAMAEIMREHTLSSTGGLTYAEMAVSVR